MYVDNIQISGLYLSNPYFTKKKPSPASLNIIKELFPQKST